MCTHEKPSRVFPQQHFLIYDCISSENTPGTTNRGKEEGGRGVDEGSLSVSAVAGRRE